MTLKEKGGGGARKIRFIRKRRSPPPSAASSVFSSSFSPSTSSVISGAVPTFSSLPASPFGTNSSPRSPKSSHCSSPRSPRNSSGSSPRSPPSSPQPPSFRSRSTSYSAPQQLGENEEEGQKKKEKKQKREKREKKEKKEKGGGEDEKSVDFGVASIQDRTFSDHSIMVSKQIPSSSPLMFGKKKKERKGVRRKVLFDEEEEGEDGRGRLVERLSKIFGDDYMLPGLKSYDNLRGQFQDFSKGVMIHKKKRGFMSVSKSVFIGNEVFFFGGGGRDLRDLDY